MIIYALNPVNISFNTFLNYFWYYALAICGFMITGVIILYLLKTKDIIRELPPLTMPNTGIWTNIQDKYQIDFEVNNSINPRTMTKFVKKDQINSSWYEIDATNAVVGRLATIVSKIIRGKNKTTYTPHMDNGDFVVVKNIEILSY